MAEATDVEGAAGGKRSNDAAEDTQPARSQELDERNGVELSIVREVRSEPSWRERVIQRSISMKPRMPSPGERIVAARKAQLLLITATMAAVEVENRNVLGALSASSVVILAGGVYISAGKGAGGASGAGVVVVLSFGALWLIRKTTKKIEEMDEYARKFEAANEFYLEGLEGDALGPAPFAPAEPVRQPDEAATVESLVARAEELKERFRVEVMLVLAECDATNVALGPNIKSAERSKEKVRLDYGGDARMLKDALRCSVICERIEHLCACYAKLQELEQEGFVQILLVRSSVREESPTKRPANWLCARARSLLIAR